VSFLSTFISISIHEDLDSDILLICFPATYVDFFDAAHVKWVEAASPEKLSKLMGLYGDDTFTKLMKKVGKYSV